MAFYVTRQKNFTSATTTFGVIDLGLDGSTVGTIKIPFYKNNQPVTRISKITAAYAVDGGHVTISGTVGVLRISGTGSVLGIQDLVLQSEHMEDGGGTLTYTTVKNITPVVIPVDIPVKAGNDVGLSFAYYGTDSGTQYVEVTLELT